MAPIATTSTAPNDEGNQSKRSIPVCTESIGLPPSTLTFQSQVSRWLNVFLLHQAISIAPLLDPSATDASRQETSTALLSAFRKYGFLYLTSFSALLSPELLKKVFNQSAHFFELPLATKDSVAWTTARANRGYTGMGREKVSAGLTPEEVKRDRLAEGGDLKESFEIGREGEEGYPNRWYEDDPNQPGVRGAQEFRGTMSDFFERCKEMHKVLMRGIAVGLGIEETFFDKFTRQGDNTLRLLHYPPVAAGGFEGGKRVRAGAHTDYGSITLLFQDSRGGLQVEPPEGAENEKNWIEVEPREDTIVVNAGDLLTRWSNDLIRSTRHRVVEPPPPKGESKLANVAYPARYSVAYFCNPDFDGWIEVLPGTWEGEREGRKYEGINSCDYLVQRLSATY